MTEALTILLMGAGTAFMVLAAIGIVRLPDLFTRMHAATKVGTLGASGIVLALAVHFDDLGVTTRALFVIGFLFLTAPIAAHMLGRAAYFTGVPFWEGTGVDELKEAGDGGGSRASGDPKSPNAAGEGASRESEDPH